MVVLEWEGHHTLPLRERLLVESGFEDRLDTLIGERLQGLSPPTGGFEAHHTVRTLQVENAQTGAITLRRMRPPRQEFRHDSSGGRPDGLGPLDQS